MKKLWILFDTNQKLFFTLIVFLTCMSTILEMLGVGLIFPLIASITDQTNIIKEKSGFIYEILKNLSTEDIIFYILIIFLIKTLFLTLVNLLTSKFSFRFYYTTLNKLFREYLNKPYEFFLNRNSSEFIRNVTSETSVLVVQFVSPLFVLISEIVILIGLGVLLFYLEPKIFTISLIVIFLFYFLFILSTKSRIKKWSYQRQLSEKKSILYVQQAIRAIKNIKILSKEEFFIKHLKNHSQNIYKLLWKMQFLRQVPRHWLEFLFILIICFSLFFLFEGEKMIEFLPSLSIFAVSFVRLMPSLNRILPSYQSLKFSYPALEIIYDDMKKISKQKDKRKKINYFIPPQDDILIQLKNINFKYKNTKKFILKDAKINIYKNSLIGIVGESGQGKTTFLDILLGLLEPTSGEIKFNKVLMKSKNIFGYVPQNPYILDDNLINNITLDENYKLSRHEKNKLKDILLSCGLSKFESKLRTKKYQLGEEGSKLSGGEAQRVSIARCLFNKSNILILDEPTSALDSDNENKILELILRLKKRVSIVFVSHKQKPLRYCDNIYEIKNQKLHKLK